MSESNAPLKLGIAIAAFLCVGFTSGGFYIMSAKIGRPDESNKLVALHTTALIEKEEQLGIIKERRAELGTLNETLKNASWNIDATNRTSARLNVLNRKFYSHRDIYREQVARFENTRSKTNEALDGDGSVDIRQPNLASFRNRKEEEELKQSERSDELRALSDSITIEIAKAESMFAKELDDKRKERSVYETRYSLLREDLQKRVTYEPPVVDTTKDGLVLAVDLKNRLVVINIGRRHGVKPNMRFEVFQVVGGAKRIRKGFINVKQVGEETSDCVIVYREVKLPRCPRDSYVASIPEERFCPHNPGAGTASKVERLNAVPARVVFGMDELNPILVDDRINNPIFEPDRRLNIAIAGEKDNPVSTSLSHEDILQVVRWYGGNIQTSLDASSNILIAGKFAVDDIRKARELGIDVVLQSDLFDFVRN